MQNEDVLKIKLNSRKTGVNLGELLLVILSYEKHPALYTVKTGLVASTLGSYFICYYDNVDKELMFLIKLKLGCEIEVVNARDTHYSSEIFPPMAPDMLYAAIYKIGEIPCQK